MVHSLSLCALTGACSCHLSDLFDLTKAEVVVCLAGRWAAMGTSFWCRWVSPTSHVWTQMLASKIFRAWATGGDSSSLGWSFARYQPSRPTIWYRGILEIPIVELYLMVINITEVDQPPLGNGLSFPSDQNKIPIRNNELFSRYQALFASHY